MARAGDSITYGFAVGRVMVLRTRLLGRASFERLLDAPTFADQRRVLSETHFGKFLEHAATPGEVEHAVDESLRDLYEEFLEHAGLPDAVVRYFRSPYDFAVLKGVLKARALGVAAEVPTIPLGLLPLQEFDDPRTLPGVLGSVARALLDAEPVPASEEIDAAVDHAMFRELTRLAKASGVHYLERLAARQVDATNAKVLLRSAIAQRSPDAARAMLVPGGTWDAAALTLLVRKPAELVEAVMAARVLPGATPADLLDLTRLDPLADAAVGRLVREAVRMPIGPGPVLGYVLSRRAEAITVRALLVGRLAGLPRDVVASRLREVAS
ncbi:MAG: V-type ATPase subunit [Coriobacteriia bacterium]|nr:V-type ATPase subunit [Coriobacteriia bacterium]